MRRTAAIALLLAVGAAGCGSDDEEPLTREAASVQQACRDGAQPRPAEDLAALAGAPAEGSAGLVFGSRTVRPGAIVQALPVNRGAREGMYGTSYALERREGGAWRTMPMPEGMSFRAIGYRLEAGRTGQCVRVLLETSITPGEYRITVGVPDFPVRGMLTVAGEPVPASALERSLRETGDDPPSEPTTIPEVETNPSGTGAGAPTPGLGAAP